MVDLSGDPNIFPNTGFALETRSLADRVNCLAVVDQLLPWDPARARIAISFRGPCAGPERRPRICLSSFGRNRNFFKHSMKR
jgi:hypothetical protein